MASNLTEENLRKLKEFEHLVEEIQFRMNAIEEGVPCFLAFSFSFGAFITSNLPENEYQAFTEHVIEKTVNNENTVELTLHNPNAQ